MIKYLLTFFIRIYQLWVSPFFPKTCRFYPSCSAYAIQTLNHFSLANASWKIIKRIFSCHPFHPGGFDPVKELK